EGAKIVEFGNYAFAGCSKLPVLKIPASVTTVGDKVFSGCAGANSAVIEDAENTLTFGVAVFENCTNLREVRIPARVTAMPEGMFPGCASLRNVFVDENNTTLKDIDGVLFTKDGKKLLFFSPVRGGEYEVPAGVEEIGANVFQGNTALTGITFGTDVKTIGAYAFDGCTGLAQKTITIGKNVTYIGEYAFRNAKLYKLFFEEGGTEELVMGKGAFFNGVYNTTTSTSSTNYFVLAFPARLKVISDSAFETSRFYTMTLAEGIQQIGNRAFYSNQTFVGTDASTKTFTLPASITKVGNYAFSKNNKIEYLVLPNTVTSWGEYCFEDATSLKGLTLPTTWTQIPIGFMYSSSSSGARNLKADITISKTVESIGYRAFYQMFPYATGLVFEDGGTQPLVIGTKGYQNSTTKEWEDRGYYSSEAFYKIGASNSSFKTTVTLPDRLTIIGNGTFYGASKVQEFALSENSRLANIGDQAFYSCSALTKIFIPKTVTNLPQEPGFAQQPSIGTKAFNGTSKLASITFQEGGTLPLTIAATAFPSLAKTFTELKLPGRMGIAYAKDGTTPAIIGMTSTSFPMTSSGYIATITVGDGTESASSCTLKAIDNVVYTSDLTTIICAAPKSTVTELTLPKQLTTIPASTFKSNKTLTKIVFEDGGTNPLTIGSEAFSTCSNITEADLPERTVSIGSKAFQNCSKLTRVHIPKNVTEIGSAAFNGTSAAGL
ncbi:MAG: leucine-rich repeat protein, partial [Clostridia bacterium]|nr:leucine-rich repeat protein [Clostridia bacterium]